MRANPANAQELFEHHVADFNSGVTRGDFGPMVDRFDPDPRTTPSPYSARTPMATRRTPRSHGTPTTVRKPAPCTCRWRIPGSGSSSSRLIRS